MPSRSARKSHGCLKGHPAALCGLKLEGIVASMRRYPVAQGGGPSCGRCLRSDDYQAKWLPLWKEAQGPQDAEGTIDAETGVYHTPKDVRDEHYYEKGGPPPSAIESEPNGQEDPEARDDVAPRTTVTSSKELFGRLSAFVETSQMLLDTVEDQEAQKAALAPILNSMKLLLKEARNLNFKDPTDATVAKGWRRTQIYNYRDKSGIRAVVAADANEKWLYEIFRAGNRTHPLFKGDGYQKAQDAVDEATRKIATSLK